MNGALLNKILRIDAKHALYREDGNLKAILIEAGNLYLLKHELSAESLVMHNNLVH